MSDSLKRIIVDCDGVIAGKDNGGDYAKAPPLIHGIKQVNKLYDMGYEIVLYTARYGDRESGNNVINVKNLSVQNIQNAIKKALTLNLKKPTRVTGIYGNGSSAKKIVNILEKIHLDERLIQKQISY